MDLVGFHSAWIGAVLRGAFKTPKMRVVPQVSEELRSWLVDAARPRRDGAVEWSFAIDGFTDWEQQTWLVGHADNRIARLV